MDLVFASNNKHKLKEVQDLLGSEFNILSLADIKCYDEIPEDHDTLEANALQKSSHVYDKFAVSCFSDDTGLEIDALGGEPGVYSARYASELCDANANMEKVLTKMKGITNRKAQFRTIVSLIIEGEKFEFEGIVKGKIMTEKCGVSGFGYDPIFKADGYDISFAEMDLSIKNTISHRARAIKNLVHFLKTK